MTQSGFMAPGASKAKSALASIYAILEQKSNIDPSDESGMMLQEVRGEIEFHHVTFRYPTRPDVLVFRDLSLTINAGEVTYQLMHLFVWCTILIRIHDLFQTLPSLLRENLRVWLYWWKSDNCSSWRKWKWKVNSNLIIAKILWPRFRPDNTRWNWNKKSTTQMV